VSAVRRLDRYQRRHRWLGLPLAVVYKFFDDRGSYLSALVTYYSFVSLFPLLLLFYSALGFFIHGNHRLQSDLQHAVLTNFPGLGNTLLQNVHTFQGSGVALAIGILGTLYGGLGAMQAAQAGFNQIYGVPRNKQPNPIKSRVRSLGLLAVLGVGVLLSTALAITLATASKSLGLGPVLRVLGFVLNYGLNVVLFSLGFQLLTARDLRFREVAEGGMLAAGLWMALQTLGSAYLSHVLKHSTHLYNVFAVVLGMLAWLYLQSLILMLSAEINVVVHNRLWPRSLLTPFTDNVVLTEADRSVYRRYAEVQRFKGFETVTTEFDVAKPEPDGRDPGASPETEPASGAPPETEPDPGAPPETEPDPGAPPETEPASGGHRGGLFRRQRG
jgi:membrane protein